MRIRFGLLKALAVLPLVAAAFGVSTGQAAAGTNPTGVQPFIVGGENATQTYSFMGSIQIPTRQFPHYCGASLINSTWMVTAAHCTFTPEGGQWRPSDMRVRIGSNNRASGGTYASVAQIVRHPGYSPRAMNYDIALLRLTSAVTNAPISIASTSPAPNTAVRLLGWGQTCPQRGCSREAPMYLKQLDTRILSDSSCRAGGVNGQIELCVAGTTSNTACYGDSGGPQLVQNGTSWALTGATSRAGDQNSTCGTGNVIYTDVTAFRQWIAQYAGSAAAS